MRLKKFNPEMVGAQRRDKMTVRMYKKGFMTFNKITTETMGLTTSSRIEFCRDEERPNDWFIHVTKSDQGFRLWGKEGSSLINVNSVGMVREIFSDIDYFHSKALFEISDRPVELNGEKFWKLITEKPMTW